MRSVTKTCIFCLKEIQIVVEKKLDPIDARLLEEKEAMCHDCARERGLDPNEKYFVFAGDIYQKFPNAHLRLWPVGAFH